MCSACVGACREWGRRVGPAQAHVQARAFTQMSFLKYDLQFLKTGPLLGLELAK